MRQLGPGSDLGTAAQIPRVAVFRNLFPSLPSRERFVYRVR